MTSDGSEDNKLILWKGLALLMGISLLLVVVAWVGDRRSHADARHRTDEEFGRLAEEFQALRAEGHAASSEEQAMITRMAEELAGRDADIASLKDDLDAARAALALHDRQAEERTEELTESLATARKQEGLARARVVRLEEHVESLKKSHERLVSAHSVLEERLTASSQVAIGADAEREKSRAELNDLRAQNAVLEQELKVARDEVAQGQARVENAEQKLAKMTAQNAVMQQVTREAEAKVLTLQRDHQVEISNLKAQAAVAATQSAAQAQAAVQAQAQAQAAAAPQTAEVADGDARAELRILRARDETRAREIARLEQEVAALKSALERARGEPR